MNRKNPNKRNREIRLLPLNDMPMALPGDNLAELLLARFQETPPKDNDIIVIAQKIVSKAENRYVNLADIRPSDDAMQLAAETGKDPRLVELILSQSKRVVRRRRDVLIVEHELGFVHANAGIDHSNIPQNDNREMVLLLPEDANASAREIHAEIKNRLGIHLAVIINDSLGRAWRNGVTGIAIGAAGLPCLLNLCGEKDLYGNTLRATEVGIADEIAAAASLVMGQAAQGIPAVLVRGLEFSDRTGDASALIRAPDKDLFR